MMSRLAVRIPGPLQRQATEHSHSRMPPRAPPMFPQAPWRCPTPRQAMPLCKEARWSLLGPSPALVPMARLPSSILVAPSGQRYQSVRLPLNGLTIDFKMGGAAHDILYFTGNATFPTAPDSLNFEFQNLGGVTTGVNYLLISLPFLALAPSASIFSFAPDMAAAGWAGTFQSSTIGISVRFTAVPGLPGDVNGDNIVNGQDLALVASNWLNSGVGDANGDGIINAEDIALVSSSWLNTRRPVAGSGLTSPQSIVVPEPSTFALTLILIVGFVAQVRRKKRFLEPFSGPRRIA